jgi:hypothetical protein
MAALQRGANMRLPELRQLALALMSATALAGCTAENPNMGNILLATGHLRVAPHPNDPTLAVVQHINSVDFGMNLDNAADRRVLVSRLLGAQCGNPSIEDARVTLTGSPEALRQLRTYTLTVRCPNGAANSAEK